MEDIQTQIDDIVTRLDENDSSSQELSDTVDTQLSDIQSSLDETNSNIESLNETKGQLEFPLSQTTIDLINEQFPRGLITLVAGVYTLVDGRISRNSIIFITCAQFAGLNGGNIPQVIAYTGYATIVGTGPSDTSNYNYLLLI